MVTNRMGVFAAVTILALGHSVACLDDGCSSSLDIVAADDSIFLQTKASQHSGLENGSNHRDPDKDDKEQDKKALVDKLAEIQSKLTKEQGTFDKVSDFASSGAKNLNGLVEDMMKCAKDQCSASDMVSNTAGIIAASINVFGAAMKPFAPFVSLIGDFLALLLKPAEKKKDEITLDQITNAVRKVVREELGNYHVAEHFEKLEIAMYTLKVTHSTFVKYAQETAWRPIDSSNFKETIKDAKDIFKAQHGLEAELVEHAYNGAVRQEYSPRYQIMDTKTMADDCSRQCQQAEPGRTWYGRYDETYKLPKSCATDYDRAEELLAKLFGLLNKFSEINSEVFSLNALMESAVVNHNDHFPKDKITVDFKPLSDLRESFLHLARIQNHIQENVKTVHQHCMAEFFQQSCDGRFNGVPPFHTEGQATVDELRSKNYTCDYYDFKWMGGGSGPSCYGSCDAKDDDAGGWKEIFRFQQPFECASGIHWFTLGAHVRAGPMLWYPDYMNMKVYPDDSFAKNRPHWSSTNDLCRTTPENSNLGSQCWGSSWAMCARKRFCASTREIHNCPKSLRQDKWPAPDVLSLDRLLKVNSYLN